MNMKLSEEVNEAYEAGGGHLIPENWSVRIAELEDDNESLREDIINLPRLRELIKNELLKRD